MEKGSWLATISVLLMFGLAACGRSGPAPASPPEISLDDALARVRQHMPASRYVTNDLLPTGDKVDFSGDKPSVKLRVGMPWVLNDEIARLKASIASKQSSRGVADSFFKK